MYTAKPGRLFVWGSSKPTHAFPDIEKDKVDKDGDVCFPTPLFPKYRFHQISADTGGVFAALDEKRQILMWGSQRNGFPEKPQFLDVPRSHLVVNKNSSRPSSRPSSPTGVRPGVKASFCRVVVGESVLLAVEEETGAILEYHGEKLGWMWINVTDMDAPTNPCEQNVNDESSITNESGKPVCTAYTVHEIDCCHKTAMVLISFNGDPSKKYVYVRCLANNPKAVAAYPSVVKPGPALWKFVPLPAGSTLAPDHSYPKFIALGSLMGAVVTEDNQVITWGANRNGNLAIGMRNDVRKEPTRARTVIFPDGFCHRRIERSEIVSIWCTRGQPNPKNDFAQPVGQEGPRCHILTACGRMFIAGTCHKGLGADHLGKIMTPKEDHLTFYEVGGPAADLKREVLASDGPANGTTNVNGTPTAATNGPANGVSNIMGRDSVSKSPNKQQSVMNAALAAVVAVSPSRRADGSGITGNSNENSDEKQNGSGSEKCTDETLFNVKSPPKKSDALTNDESATVKVSEKARYTVRSKSKLDDLCPTGALETDLTYDKLINSAGIQIESDLYPDLKAKVSKEQLLSLLSAASARREYTSLCTNYLTNCRIIGCAVSHIHSLAMSADGRVFGWGCGSNGRLGLKEFFSPKDGKKRVMKCYISTPTKLELPRVLAIASGRYWSFAIVEHSITHG